MSRYFFTVPYTEQGIERILSMGRNPIQRYSRRVKSSFHPWRKYDVLPLTRTREYRLRVVTDLGRKREEVYAEKIWRWRLRRLRRRRITNAHRTFVETPAQGCFSSDHAVAYTRPHKDFPSQVTGERPQKIGKGRIIVAPSIVPTSRKLYF